MWDSGFRVEDFRLGFRQGQDSGSRVKVLGVRVQVLGFSAGAAVSDSQHESWGLRFRVQVVGVWVSGSGARHARAFAFQRRA